MDIDNSLLRALLESGFDRTPALLLARLISHGGTTAGRLARLTGVKRPTAYAALDNLVDAGFVARGRRGGTTRYEAAPLESIIDSISGRAEEQHLKLKNAAQQLRALAANLSPRGEIALGAFELSTIESPRSFYEELERALGRGEYSGIFNPQIACHSRKGKELTARFLKETGAKKSNIREIIITGPLAQWYRDSIKNPNHQVREMAGGAGLPTDMIFTGEAVIFAHYGPLEMAIKIRHPDLSRSMLTVFETLWAAIPA